MAFLDRSDQPKAFRAFLPSSVRSSSLRGPSFPCTQRSATRPRSARALYRYLDSHTLADLLNFCINVHNKKVSDLYSKPRLLGYEIEQLDSALSPLLEWLSKNPMPDGTHRNSRLLKNLAIYWVLKGLSDDRIRHEARKILSMTRDKRETEVMGWVSWARRKREKGQKVTVNLGEIRTWVKDAKAPVRV